MLLTADDVQTFLDVPNLVPTSFQHLRLSQYIDLDGLRSLIGKWVVEAICARIPPDLVVASEQPYIVALARALDENKSQATTELLSLTLVYITNFWQAKENHLRAPAIKEIVLWTGIGRNRVSRLLKAGYEWVVSALMRRERLLGLGFPPRLIGNLSELPLPQLEEVLNYYPSAFGLYHELQGAGKTHYAIHLAEALLTQAVRGNTTPSFDEMVFLEFLSIFNQPPYASHILIEELHRALLKPQELRLTTGEQLSAIHEVLVGRNVLIVLDNLETVEEASTAIQLLVEQNPTTGFILAGRSPLMVRGVRAIPIPLLPDPYPLVQSIIGLESPLPSKLRKLVTEADQRSPLFWQYLVKDLDIDALMTYLQNLREGKLKIQLDRLFDEIWGKFAAETQTALMSMLLSSRQGENREWVEIASGLSPEKLNTAWAVLDRVPVWRSIDTSDSRTPPSLSNRKSRRSQRRASDVSERRTLNPYTADRLISLGQKAPWKGWLEQRRETILQNLLQGQVIPDNLRWVFHHIESIEQLLINYFKGKKRLSLSFWQMLANYATIAFECGRWIEIKTLCDQIFAEVWNIDSLDEFLAIQEIVMVRCDAWSSINGTISNSDRVTEIKAFIDQIERDFSAFFKDHIDAQYITPLLDAVRALVIFNRGSSLIEARNLIDSALEGMDENLMSDAMAFSRGIAGFIYWRMGDSQARLLFTQALQHYRDTNQIFRTAWIESNIALAYQSWLTLDEAHDLIQSALNRGETLGQTWTTITNLGTRALIELARGRLKETALTFEQQEVHLIGAIPVKHQAQAYDQMWERLEYQDYDYDKEKHDVSMKREFARLMGNWGNVLIHQNQYEKAVKALKIDLKLGKGVRAVRSHCETHINLALALIQQGKPSDAIEHLQAASEIFEAGGYDILRLLWLRANALINPPDIALEQLNQAITIARQKGRRLDIAGILLQQSNLLPNTDSLRKEAIEILWEIGADGWSRRLKTGENVFIPLMY